ncbi:hypothetical protein MKY14_15425 [Paenibacillus sp. FSL R5-0887]|uniref:hypothetical protein n=1 Tax=Paenibacillus sp. FSL R5-0887 TaxID=2921662 RepID=UPI0030F738D5
MNSKAASFIKNFSYTIASNLISLVVSTVVILIVPKLIGIDDYGYWQLYLFYISYVGFLHFGWNDGIYLRYGGKQYSELNEKLFFSQFYMLFFFQIFVAIILFTSARFIIKDDNKLFIIEMVACGLILLNTRYMLLYILQATNRIKDYSQIIIMDRLVYILLLLSFLAFGIRDYKLMIIADLIGKLVALIYSIYCCKNIIFLKISSFFLSFSETKENINVGIKLMFSNMASILIIGVVRFGIEQNWDVETFGKLALTLSISNLMMLFINAVGIILFPILRRTDVGKLSNIYCVMRDVLMVMLLGVLIINFPLKFVMTAWLPEYSDSLIYMTLVFPMFIYEGKMALLINTFLKTMRKEKQMLRINIISLMLSILVTILTSLVFKNLDLAILSIVMILAFRCVLAEIFISKLLGISLTKDILLEIMLTLIFVLAGWFINSWIAVLIYTFAYLIYLIIKRNDISITMKNFKLLMK